MALALVQYATASNNGSAPGPRATLAATPSAGNVLIAICGGGSALVPTQNIGETLTVVGTRQQAHPTIGEPSYGSLFYRIVESGDGVTYGFTQDLSAGIILAEFSGLAAGAPSGIVENGGNTGTTLALILVSDGSYPGFAGFITRLDLGGTFTPNGDSTQVGSIQTSGAHQDGMILVYGAGDATLGGTQGGTTKDGYHWGGTGFAWAPVTAVAADFIGTPLSGAAPLDVAFTDLSTGDPDTWAWDFGDGGTSTSQNPTHTFTLPGTYDVELVATRSGDAASDTATRTAYVISIEAKAGVFIDWDGDGFDMGDHDAIHEEPGNRVVSWTITRGASAEITGSSNPGAATLTLKNPSDVYNPRNASSPLTGLITDGVPVWIGINSDGKLTGDDPRGLFGGRITDVTLIPAGGASESPTVEIACEDALGWYQRTPVQLDYAEGLAHDALRLAALQAAGETRYDLAHEIHTMPLSHADGDLRSVLDDINAVNGTRHLAKPAGIYTDWYRYTTRNRQYKLAGVADESLDAASDHVTDTSGWRLSADTVTNRQRASVTPIVFTPGTFTVWEADTLPFELTDRSPRRFIVDFDDVVRDAVLDIASTGDTVTAVLTPFATAAKIELSVGSGDTATVTALSVEGRLARRLEQQTAQSDDTDSQAAPRGIREGSEIGNEYLGVLASAQGITAHVVWRYGDPQLRPTLTVVNWFPEMFELDLYDVISFTSSQLGMSAVLFEIVGLTHEGLIAANDVQLHTVTYVLQESRVQAPYDWFYLDSGPNSSVLDGEFHLAY